MKHGIKTTLDKCSYFSSMVIFAATCAAALTSLAATTSTWTGGASGIWGSDYQGNWSGGYPTSTAYATFGEPKSEPITVQVDESVDAYGIVGAAARTAGLNFTGSGTFTNHRGTLFEAKSGYSLTDWNINVVSAVAATMTGTNRFYKTLDCSGVYNFDVNDKADVKLCGTAQMSGQHVRVYAGGAFECLDSSTMTLTKDLNVYPGASLTVADNAVLTIRGLALPFSKEEGVSDGWTMDGGKLNITASGGFNAAGKSLYYTYTNATKTVSGTGTIQMYKLDLTSASNTILRLDGPDLYLRNVGGQYKYNNVLDVRGGSTIGAYGANVNLANNWYTRFYGSAAIDTTDYADKTTPRIISLSRLYSSSGDLAVKGVGELRLGVSMTHPNLNITVQDGATFNTQSNALYAIGDIVLKDSAKFVSDYYIGHKDANPQYTKSLTMSGDTTFRVARYAQISGDVALSGNAVADVWNWKKETTPLACANLSLSDNASLSVSGAVSCAALSLSGNGALWANGAVSCTGGLSLSDGASLIVNGGIAATSLAMSGDAHLAFTAGTAFSAGATFGDGDWTMDIKIPANYEAGMHPIVTGVELGDDFANHVTLAGETNGWSVGVIDGMPVLYKGAAPSGIEWIGGSETSDNWSDSANWNDGVLPGVNDHVAFGGISRLTSYNDSLNTASGLVFRASAGPFVLTGSVEKITLKADCNSRGSATEEKANIVSHSGFTQTIAIPVEFKRCAYVLSDGGGEVVLKNGFYQGTDTTWQYFIAGGEVAIGGTCSASKLGFRTAASGKPTTCLRLLPGCDFTLRSQGYNSFTESASYVGRFVIEEGASLTVNGGECSFYYGALQNVVNGVYRINDGDSDDGRIIAGQNEQYYTGSGTIYAVRARASRNSGSRNHYVNFGGTLKLYMGGDWNTASPYSTTVSGNSTVILHDPNCPTRFRMTDGTTLGATADWTYGPSADAFNTTNETVTAAGRAAVMTGTVTVDTQDPNDATKSHTITFADPLDASAATIVKNGEGSLVFNTPAQYQLQFGSLTVNEGVVSFAVAPTFSGTLTIASGAQFRADAAVADAGWTTIATATSITGPGGATEWKTDDGAYKFRIVTSGGGAQLECSKDTGVVIFFL